MAYKTNNPYEKKRLEEANRKKKKRTAVAGITAGALVVVIAAIIVIPKLTASRTSVSGAVTRAVITMENGGEIELELYPDIAPITVANFVELSKSGFYDGLTFHRISPSFMIQGGDPNGDGTGGSGTGIKGEFSENGVANPINHDRGVISMARRSDSMDSATSQFFIMTADSRSALDGKYAAFGRVVSGMDVVDRIATAESTLMDDGTGRPVTPEKIKSITIG